MQISLELSIYSDLSGATRRLGALATKRKWEQLNIEHYKCSEKCCDATQQLSCSSAVAQLRELNQLMALRYMTQWAHNQWLWALCQPSTGPLIDSEHEHMGSEPEQRIRHGAAKKGCQFPWNKLSKSPGFIFQLLCVKQIGDLFWLLQYCCTSQGISPICIIPSPSL